jgi:hypothetical protein
MGDDGWSSASIRVSTWGEDGGKVVKLGLFDGDKN